jgi:hypothetical protein
MMKYFFFVGLAVSVLTLFFFNSMGSALFESGFSWTFSKLLPYLLLLFSGIMMIISKLFSISTIKFLTPKLPILKFVLYIIYLCGPFAIGFAMNPIYEGDFAMNGTEIQEDVSLKEFKSSDLVVITIPGCPFCFESISDLKKLKARKPSMKINYIVCSKDKAALTIYKKEIDGAFKCSLASDAEKMMQIAEGTFPTFVLVKDKKAVSKWSNNQFGVRAKDLIESEIQ